MAPSVPSSHDGPEGSCLRTAREVTVLLSRLREGEAGVVDQLLPLVYAELRGLAGAIFADQRPGHTLQPTALVHEAWLKLHGGLGTIEDRRHFLIVAGRAMRQVVADHARAHNAQKRGDGRRKVALETDVAAGGGREVDLVDLDDSLRELAERKPRHAEVAELRLFSGLSIDEIADALGVSPRTVDSDWAMARAWLRKELVGGG